MSSNDVLIIGAGPFGLSVSAHLHSLGVEHRIVGRPMDTWKSHMPVGMNLRSEPYGSDMAAPKDGYDVATYCHDRNLDYVDRLGPLTMERFLDYCDWYTDELVPNIEDLTVTKVVPTNGGFSVSFAQSDPITARIVIVATGVLPYKTMPEELAGLPADLVSHTADHSSLEKFRGQKVAMIGGGQSALETAALLHEAGADIEIVMRRPQISWLTPNPETLSKLGQIRWPVNKMCEGWHCVVWNSPALFGLLPEKVRIDKARTVLGPAGAWWLKDRVEGVIPVHTSHQLRAAVATESGVALELSGPELRTLEVDHVMAGTGFKVDIARLPFFSEATTAGISTRNGYPLVTRSGQSSLRGLYFTGSPTAVSLGPSVRFIAGTHNLARQLAHDVAKTQPKARPTSASPARVPATA